MSIRAFRLPQDVQTMIDILPLAFQYPENPAWSVDTEESENYIETAHQLQKLWPLLRILLKLSPKLAQELNGVVWEEEHKPVGIANVGRQGGSDNWYISNVGVLPAYRRRGIARKLTEAAIAHARQQGAKRVTLLVIDGNDPAFNLYKSLGFEKYDTGVDLTAHQPVGPLQVELPVGYVVKPESRRQWRPLYELAHRITPVAVRRYEPVEEARYRRTWVNLALALLINRGERKKKSAIYTDTGDIVAVASYSARLRPGGVNSLEILLDPAHGVLSAYLMRSLVAEIVTISPGRTIQFRVRGWTPSLKDAALEIGFTLRRSALAMGMAL